MIDNKIVLELNEEQLIELLFKSHPIGTFKNKEIELTERNLDNEGGIKLFFNVHPLENDSNK